MLSFIRPSANFRDRTSHNKDSRFHPDHFQVHGGVQVDKVVGLRGFVDIRQHHRKITLHGGVLFVLGLHADGIGRGVGFEIESGSGLERTVGLEREE